MILEENFGLQSEKKWNKHILSVIEKVRKKEMIKGEKAVKELRKAIVKGFDQILPQRFILLFSGGVDSALIALISKQLRRDFLCISGGFKDSHDVVLAKQITESLNLKTEFIYFDNLNMLDALKKSKRITRKSDVVNIEVGAVSFLLLKNSKKAEVFDYVATGLGAEELFIGYQKYATAENPYNASIKGLKEIYKKDILRDQRVCRQFSKRLILPFLHPRIIETALRIPIESKLKDGYKKYCLRVVTINLGLKREWAFERKKAAQYGTQIDKEIAKIAKKKGFKGKREFLSSL